MASWSMDNWRYVERQSVTDPKGRQWSVAMMDILQVTILILVAAGATAVVLIRERVRQVLVLSVYGVLLAVLFLAFQAPDVTLSELTVGAIVLPILLLLTLAKVKGRQK